MSLYLLVFIISVINGLVVSASYRDASSTWCHSYHQTYLRLLFSILLTHSLIHYQLWLVIKSRKNVRPKSSLELCVVVFVPEKRLALCIQQNASRTGLDGRQNMSQCSIIMSFLSYLQNAWRRANVVRRDYEIIHI